MESGNSLRYALFLAKIYGKGLDSLSRMRRLEKDRGIGVWGLGGYIWRDKVSRHRCRLKWLCNVIRKVYLDVDICG